MPVRSHHASISSVALFVGAVLVSCSSTDESALGPGGSGAGAASGGSSSTGGATTTSSSNLDVDDDGDGFSELQGDCNDADPGVHPGADEVCDDGVDNNCNGSTDGSEPDGDGDGFGPCGGDCDDDDPAVSPAAAEIAGDGIDNDCDGVTDADFDGDGYGEADGDCDDDDPTVHPGVAEACFDGVDNDCNGYVDGAEPDGDGDGYGPCGGDCDDGDPAVGPGQPEIDGDGIDNNCDNLVDLDIDGDGWTTTNGDCADDDPSVNPSVLEVCGDGIDNDCDGTTDIDCLTPCDLAEITRSSVGCTFYGVDTDHYFQYDPLQYAVVVSNIHPTDSANVDVEEKVGGTWQVVQSASVSAGGLHEFDLPDKHIDDTGVHAGGAYRVVSDLPVIAYQFSPVDGVASFSSDASLLLPTSAWDTVYQVVGYQGNTSNAILTHQMNIVAMEDATSVTITPACDTVAGGGVPALSAGTSYTFPQTYDAGDYIQLSGTPSSGQSFTGTVVTADKAVAVFSAHIGNNIPSAGPCCADHLEEQMFGLQTWGTRYVASRMPVRNLNIAPEPTIWHIYASEDGTQVSFSASPEVTGLPPGPQSLGAGQWLELTVAGTAANPGDFIVTANNAIHVMGYLTSAGNTNAPAAQAGDPAMTQMVPTAQLLDSYVVLVPANWNNDYFILTKPVGASVDVDGSGVLQSAFVAIDDGQNPVEWEVARIATSDGVHTLSGSAPFGVVVVGYDSYDSYAYPGGLDQQIINPKN